MVNTPVEKVDKLCRIYQRVRSLRKVRKITGHSINFIKKCIKPRIQLPIYPRPLKEGYEKLTAEKVRIFAHTVFDGHISHSKTNSYTVGYTNSAPELIKEFKEDVLHVYGLKPTVYDRGDVVNLFYSSKLMYLDIKNFDKRLVRLKEDYKKIYLRAFFDDEGCVMFRPKKGKFHISGSQKDQKEILFIESLLNDLGISTNVYRSIIEITYNKDLFHYASLIGFTHIKKRSRLFEGMTYYSKKQEKINSENSKIEELHNKDYNPYKISKLIGMPPSTIRNRIKTSFNSRKVFRK